MVLVFPDDQEQLFFLWIVWIGWLKSVLTPHQTVLWQLGLREPLEFEKVVSRSVCVNRPVAKFRQIIFESVFLR